jgi:O-antigen/teichoic acid export membrane protein
MPRRPSDADRRRAKVVAVTSSFPDEGKTTLSLSLARQASLGGLRTLLIEGDLRKLGLREKLKTMSAEAGLVEVLKGAVTIDGAIRQEPSSGVDMLLGFGPAKDAFALARSAAMADLLADVRPRYDLIVIDCGPILAVSDTRSLVDLSDEVLFVLRWQTTDRAAARTAIRDLTAEHAGRWHRDEPDRPRRAHEIWRRRPAQIPGQVPRLCDRRLTHRGRAVAAIADHLVPGYRVVQRMPKKSAWIAIRNVGWAGVEALTSVLVSLIAMLGIARMVGAAEFGLGALALGITQILTVVLGSLFHDALVRNPGLERRHFDSAFTATVLLSLIAFLICLALAQPLAIFFKEPRFTLVFIVMAVGLIPEAAGATLVAERRRELDFRLVTLHFMAARGFGAIAGVICAVAGLGVWSLVVQQYVTTVLALIVLLIFGSHRPRFRLVIADLIPMVRFTCSIIATQFVIQFSLRLMLIYVARVGDLTLAGYWGLADRLVDALQRTITNALYHVSLSHFSKVQDNHERLGVLVRQANVWLASLVFPGLALLAVVGPEVIDFLLGEAWLPAGVAVQVLAIGVIIQLRRLMDHVALNALGYSEVAFVAYLFEAGLWYQFVISNRRSHVHG